MENKTLTLIDKHTVKNESKFSPKEDFVTHEGVYVSAGFRSRVLEDAEAVEAGHAYVIASFDLKSPANDAAIESALLEKHIFYNTEVCAVVADLIEKQPRGEEGVLIVTGRANLFYTPAFVVGVGWRAGHGGWRVNAWERDGDAWYAGGRVFSPATDS